MNYADKNCFKLEYFATKVRTVRMVALEVFDPVVDIIRQVHPGKYIQDCTVAHY
jgi:hypothetical protein